MHLNNNSAKFKALLRTEIHLCILFLGKCRGYLLQSIIHYLLALFVFIYHYQWRDSSSNFLKSFAIMFLQKKKKKRKERCLAYDVIYTRV